MVLVTRRDPNTDHLEIRHCKLARSISIMLGLLLTRGKIVRREN